MDQRITCCECGQVFVFNEAEQQFYASKEMKPPKRCKTCRRARKLQAGDRSSRPSFPAVASSSGDLGPSSSGELPPARDSRPSRPNRDSRPSRPRFEITCSVCQAVAEVPFRPAEGRQVYCPRCYRAKKGNERLATDGLDVDEADLGIVES
jgi:CxxC-x17-CxxC domain-containing protein